MSGLVSIVVNLQTNDPPLGEYAAPGGSLQKSSAIWYLIYTLGTIPSGISNCYKQKWCELRAGARSYVHLAPPPLVSCALDASVVALALKNVEADTQPPPFVAPASSRWIWR